MEGYKLEVLGYIKSKDANVVYPFYEKDENGYMCIVGERQAWMGSHMWDEVDKPERNPILENVKIILDKQTQKGIAKYGTTVNSDDYTLEQWIDQKQEESADALVYTEP